MTHDANFRDDRLRLASFLRVVERGMPPRPSRFKPKLHSIDEAPSATSSASPFQVSLANDLIESPCQLSASVSVLTTIFPASTAEFDTDPAVDRAVSAQQKALPSNLTQDRDDNPRGISTLPIDIGWSRTFHPHRRAKGDQEHSNHFSPLRNSTQHISHHTPSSKATRTLAKRSCHNRTQRSLPVNTLVLLRTSTTEGLPAPCDADNALAIPVTDKDPIDDSQAFVCSRFVKVDAQGRTAQRQVVRPRVRKAPRNDDSGVAEPYSNSNIDHAKPTSILLPSSKFHQDLNFGARFDGFVGSEMVSVPKKRARHRSKRGPMERKTDRKLRGLDLVPGTLPMPILSGVEYPERLPGHSQSAISQSITGPDRDHLSHTSDIPYDRRTKKSRSSLRELALNYQLSSITAPLRDSDSSSSNSSIEDGGWHADSEEDYHADDNAFPDDYFLNGSSSHD